MAEAFGARHVQVVAALEGEVNDDTVQGFAALCDRAAEHGLLVALEFIPVTIVPDTAVATRRVSEAGRANGGLCVDSWDFYRGAADEAQLRAIPPERVIVIQLDDGPAQPRDPEYFSDTIHFRNMPGEGEFDLVQFLRLLRDTGAEAPVSVEILSDALDSWERSCRAEPGRVLRRSGTDRRPGPPCAMGQARG
jgi:sugar phosphate isomerase/epimerase